MAFPTTQNFSVIATQAGLEAQDPSDCPRRQGTIYKMPLLNNFPFAIRPIRPLQAPAGYIVGSDNFPNLDNGTAFPTVNFESSVTINVDARLISASLPFPPNRLVLEIVVKSTSGITGDSRYVLYDSSGTMGSSPSGLTFTFQLYPDDLFWIEPTVTYEECIEAPVIQLIGYSAIVTQMTM